ncbi:MAG: hypothetical protein EAZ51_09900, partial [Sphingobacteriales bacterium]
IVSINPMGTSFRYAQLCSHRIYACCTYQLNLQLPKFTKQANQLTSIIDQWVFFINNAENLDVVPENIADKGLKVAY